MMKKLNLLIYLLLGFGVIACNDMPDEHNKQGTGFKIPPVRTGTYYETELSGDNAVVIADTIIYSVVTKNSNPDDDWRTYCLRKLDQQALVNIIFNAIYQGKLIPYDYSTEEPMSIEEVKAFEKENDRKKIAKIQFVEEWYFDEKNLQMGKRVNAIMLAYELRNSKGEVSGYKAGVKVYLNNKEVE
ncbi:MAG: hypothetical protein L3J74_09375 [Bacteroidales bacterium]|nr:hypothetical protein [Bacteroidales bacterium]